MENYIHLMKQPFCFIYPPSIFRGSNVNSMLRQRHIFPPAWKTVGNVEWRATRFRQRRGKTGRPKALRLTTTGPADIARQARKDEPAQSNFQPVWHRWRVTSSAAFVHERHRPHSRSSGQKHSAPFLLGSPRYRRRIGRFIEQRLAHVQHPKRLGRRMGRAKAQVFQRESAAGFGGAASTGSVKPSRPADFCVPASGSGMASACTLGAALVCSCATGWAVLARFGFIQNGGLFNQTGELVHGHNLNRQTLIAHARHSAWGPKTDEENQSGMQRQRGQKITPARPLFTPAPLFPSPVRRGQIRRR